MTELQHPQVTPEVLFAQAMHRLDTDPYATEGTEQGAIAAGEASRLITQGLMLANNGDRVFLREFNEYTDEPVEPFSSVRETRYAAKLRKGQGITVEVDMKLTDDHDTGSTDHIAVEVRGYNGTLVERVCAR